MDDGSVPLIASCDTFSLFDWNEETEDAFLELDMDEKSLGNNSLFLSSTDTTTNANASTSNNTKKEIVNLNVNLISNKTKREKKEMIATQTRREHARRMLKMPLEFLHYLNSGDFQSLQTLIQQYFSSDCEFQCTNMLAPVFGNDKVFKAHQHAHESAPDCIALSKQITFDARRGVVFAHVLISGTKCFCVQPSFHACQSSSSSSSTTTTGFPMEDVELQMRLKELTAAAKPVEIAMEVRWVLFLNASLEKVQKFHVHKRLLLVNDATTTTTTTTG